MMVSVRTGRVMALACALFALTLASPRTTIAAPHAAELGPVVRELLSKAPPPAPAYGAS